MAKKSLVEILKNGADRDRVQRQWDDAKPADDFSKAVSRGDYICHITAGELITSQANNTPGYNITFTVIDGEHTGRKFWYTAYLSDAAMSMAKRDLNKLGVTSLDQLEQPLPQGMRCRVTVGIRTDNDGAQWNRVRAFEVIGIDAPELDPFAPVPANDATGAP